MKIVTYSAVAIVFLLAISSASTAAGDDAVTKAVVLQQRPAFLEFVSRDADYLPMLNEIYRDPEIAAILARSYVTSLSDDFWERLPHPQFSSYRPRLKNPALGVIRLPAEDFARLFRAWDILGHPAFVVVDIQGRIVTAHEGRITAAELRDMLLQGAPPVPEPEIQPGAPLAVPQDVYYPAPTIQPAPVSTVPPQYSVPVENTNPTPPIEPIGSAQLAGDATPTIEYGTRKTTTMLGDNAAEIHEFAKPTLWTIELSGGEDVDMDLAVYNDNNELVALAESESSRETLDLAVQPGAKYHLRVYALDLSVEEESYSLDETYAPLPIDRIAPSADATMLKEGVEWKSEFSEKELDFRFLPVGPGEYIFRYTSGDRALQAILTDEAGRIIATGEDNSVMVEITEPITLNLRIIGEDLFPEPTSVIVEKNSVPAGPEPGAVDLSPSSVIQDRLGADAGVQKVYAVRVDEPGLWDIVLEGGSPATDVDMELLTSEGELLWRSENPASRETIRHEINPDDELLLRVYRYRGGEPVDFVLGIMPTVNASDFTPPNDITQLEVSDAVEGQIPQNDEIWYQVVPARSGLVSVFLSGSDNTEDIDIAVYNTGGQRIAVSQSYAADEAILLRVRQAEPVLIKIFTYGDSLGGDYRLWIQYVEP